MKIKVTVNLGNYENVAIESTEFSESNDCYKQIRLALLQIREPKVDDFVTKYIGSIIDRDEE